VPKGIQITVVGMGAIGTSIGLALKRAEPAVRITGHDKEVSAAGRARKAHAVDRTEWNLVTACENADVTIIATDLSGVKETLSAAGPYFKPGSLVMDTASVKVPVLRWAGENLAEGVSFVGGSPILPDRGGETDVELFSGVTYCLCPGVNASSEAVEWASDLVSALGARPFFIGAAEHDGLMAAVSHLPILLATSLLRVASANVAWRESARLAGSRFGGATGALVGSASAQRELCQSNAENILRWIELFQADLEQLRQAIVSGNAEALEEAFDAALQARDSWERGEVESSPEPIKYERGFRSLFLGKL